jgi:hypothetical protein
MCLYNHVCWLCSVRVWSIGMVVDDKGEGHAGSC